MAIKKTALTMMVDASESGNYFSPHSIMLAVDRLRKLVEDGATAGRFSVQLPIIEDGDRRFAPVLVEFKIEEIGPNMRQDAHGVGGVVDIIDMRETGMTQR